MNSVGMAAETRRLLKIGLEYSGKFCDRQAVTVFRSEARMKIAARPGRGVNARFPGLRQLYMWEIGCRVDIVWTLKKPPGTCRNTTFRFDESATVFFDSLSDS